MREPAEQVSVSPPLLSVQFTLSVIVLLVCTAEQDNDHASYWAICASLHVPPSQSGMAEGRAKQ